MGLARFLALGCFSILFLSYTLLQFFKPQAIKFTNSLCIAAADFLHRRLCSRNSSTHLPVFLALLVATRELCCGVSGLIPSTNDFFAAAATAAGKKTTFLLAPRRVKEEEEDDGGSSEKLLLSRRSGAVPLLLQQPLHYENKTPSISKMEELSSSSSSCPS